MGIIKNTLYKLAPEKRIKLFANKSFSPYYHLVSDKAVPHIQNLYRYKTEKEFEQHLDFFLKHYRCLSIQEVFQSIKKEGKLPRNSFFLNFDDGLSEVYEVVRPILKKKGIEAATFLCDSYLDNKNLFYKHKISLLIDKLTQHTTSESTKKEIQRLVGVSTAKHPIENQIRNIGHTQDALIDKIAALFEIDFSEYLKTAKPYMTSEQVQTMIREGFSFGGHTVNHFPLDKLSLEEQYAEIIGSVEFVKNTFNLDYTMFSFPFSDKEASKALLMRIFSHDPDILLFGNSGLVKDIDPRMIQRISLEKAKPNIGKHLVAEFLYGQYKRLSFQAKVKRV